SYIKEIFDIASETAAKYGGSTKNEIEIKYPGFDIELDNLLVKNAEKAAKEIGLEPFLAKTLGGADTMYFNKNGLACITLGNGFRNVHTYQEYISINNLTNIVKYSVSLIQSWYDQHKE